MKVYKVTFVQVKNFRHIIRSKEKSRFAGAFKWVMECGKEIVAADVQEASSKLPICKNCAGTQRGEEVLGEETRKWQKKRPKS